MGKGRHSGILNPLETAFCGTSISLADNHRYPDRYHDRYNEVISSVYIYVDVPSTHYARNGNICCKVAALLQSGHSGFSRTQSPMHSQQKTCPHCIPDGSFNSSKHSVHFRCCAPLIHDIVPSSFKLYLGSISTGVCVNFSIFESTAPAPGVEDSNSSSLFDV